MTKQDILLKIEELFYAKSFKEVSMQDLADFLGIKKASLYYHFASKNTLVLEVLEKSFLDYFEAVKSMTKGDTQSFLHDFVYYPQTHKNVFSIVNQNGFCDHAETISFVQDKQKHLMEYLGAYLKEHHHFSPERTFILVALLEDVARKKCIFWNCPIEIDKVIAEVYEVFFIS